MYDQTGKLDLTLKSLKGLWVGDCIGNVGQLYFAHDILKALDEGIIKMGADNINPRGQCFQYSDDTEEAIVLVNHIVFNDGQIKQDELAKEFATRYMDRDPDGEIYGYGLNTRKVLRDIYEGVSWREANKIIKRSEGMPSHIDSLVNSLASGKGFKEAIEGVDKALSQQKKEQGNKVKEGSCGNGSAMRVAPLGAYIYWNMPDHSGLERRKQRLIKEATLQSEVTHCHPEGIAGAIAITTLSYFISFDANNNTRFNTVKDYYDLLLDIVPKGQVWNGIKKASQLSLDTPLGKLIEILGNGTHVTCQDTVPLCVFLTIRALTQYKTEEMYEKVIIEACKCFGDVDTNCAIIGGMVGIISPVPEKWIRYCQPMEGVLDEPLPEKKREPLPKPASNEAIKAVLKETRPWSTEEGMVEDQALSIWETEKVISEALNKPRPTFEEVLEARKKELQINTNTQKENI